MIILLYIVKKGLRRQTYIEHRHFKADEVILSIRNNSKQDGSQYSLIFKDTKVKFNQIVKVSAIADFKNDPDGSYVLYSKINDILKKVNEHYQEQEKKKNKGAKQK